MTSKQALEIGLDEEVINSLSAVFRATPQLNEVLIFGSRAKGTFHEGSDIDLVVKGREVSIDTILNLKAAIEGLGLLYKIDIQDYIRISNHDLKDHIDRVGKTFWDRKTDPGDGKGLLICEAIAKMQQLQFIYNGKLRIVEPQFYGIGRKGFEQLRGYQVNEKPALEKLFDIGKIEGLEILTAKFNQPGPNYKSNDSAFVVGICKLE